MIRDVSPVLQTITSDQDAIRNRSLESLCNGIDLDGLIQMAQQLDGHWRGEKNLYQRVRALFFLASLHRYQIPSRLPPQQRGRIGFAAYENLLGRRFVESIDQLLAQQAEEGMHLALSSALARGYHQLGIQTLADQVRRSVRTFRGNQWMFRVGYPRQQPLRLVPQLLEADPTGRAFPILIERTSVRMDFSHGGWSDIFFLGMDFPEGAQVINASIDLGVHGRDQSPRPPVEAYVRIIDRPVLRLVSIDLGATAEIVDIDEVFDFAKDYLGLLKAAVIASGIVPPAMEGCHQPMSMLLETLIGRPGLGMEIVSQVNDIPKGSRLAVSTNLLGCLISALMRATGQVQAMEGGLCESERRIVAARAILGEWLGGSGGGWQDSGGVWPGIKWIHGALASEGDPEYGISRGRLLPQHEILSDAQCSDATRQALQESLILVHGGMAQNVGPILEMVTERYLLRSPAEWTARQRATEILQEILRALADGNIRRVGQLTTENFTGPLQQIIPWCTNRFTDALIEQARTAFQDQFWGFWMLGGMAGGGMGFLFHPSVKPKAQQWLQETMLRTKQQMQTSLPFAMDPVVYDFAINDRGSWATLTAADQAVMPRGYYALEAPRWIKQSRQSLTPQTLHDLNQLATTIRQQDQGGQWLLDRLLPTATARSDDSASTLAAQLAANGFDRPTHEQIREDLMSGRIGLAQNRLPLATQIQDVTADDYIETRGTTSPDAMDAGAKAIAAGQVAVMTLAAGVGSRWTGGAGVVKGLHPFCKLAGKHRSFIEVHLAKSLATANRYGAVIPHVFTTGYLTHQPIVTHLQQRQQYGYPHPVVCSRGLSVGLRTIPTERDLRFFWEETPQQVLDQQQQKVRESLRAALIGWAKTQGEASDYVDNLPEQCMHPVGHWYEFPNLLRSGTLHQLLQSQPLLKYLLLHNIDTLGAGIDPTLLGHHILRQACLSVEVIGRRIDDRGGGLARVNGQVRLVEGLAMPREEEEFALSFYNSMTTWIDIDRLLDIFGLARHQLAETTIVDDAVRRCGQRLPTYITIKDVKKRWGHGQEDVFPVTQFEKLWGDMTALPEMACQYLAVDIVRGQQLKEVAQLDGWLRDGSAAKIASQCEFSA
jgi:hypothetical protein